ncbi:hypothetical protein ISN75_02620 [Dyella marensis]|uniref:hypothetical protein n=1 Tax=Dyella marensis TaxID=500610 RepID=UPI0031E3BCB9
MARASKKKQDQYMASVELQMIASISLTEAERAELKIWEKEHVTGDGQFATSDWPGWAVAYKRVAH